MPQRFFSVSACCVSMAAAFSLIAVLVPRLDALVISEFQAENDRFLLDADGDAPDWVEVFNDGETALTLDGWSLSDDPALPGKWAFPDVVIGAGRFVVVFASGKNRALAGGELHANFKLENNGEFIGLADPSGDFVSYWSRYPRQIANVSYGWGMDVEAAAHLGAGAQARHLVPAGDGLGSAWTQPDFDDASWTSSAGAIGYDAGAEPSFADLIESDVGAAMKDLNATIYVRLAFDLAEADLARLHSLRVRYDGGFVAYLNGQEAARRNAPLALRYNSRAVQGRDASLARVFETIPLPEARRHLRAGRNVLAVQALNDRPGSDSFLFGVELDGLSVRALAQDQALYFAAPTPAWVNAPGYAGVAEKPSASHASGAYTELRGVALSSPSPAAIIRFTTDGSEPLEGSPVFAAPLAFDRRTVLKARSYQDGLLPSPAVRWDYHLAGGGVAEFSSNLPVFLISTAGRPVSTSWTDVLVLLLDPGAGGRTELVGGAVEYAGNAAIKVRGSSTANSPKPSVNIEFRNERGLDKEVEVLGFPAESDFILYSSYSFDLAMMRNPLIYELSNQIGRWAARTRYCEVYLNNLADGGPVQASHYLGVYTFMEKIKRDPSRVDVEKLGPGDNAEPEVGGGYVLKIDRLDPGDVGFSAAGQRIGFVEPKEAEASPEQKAWIANHINQMGAALGAADFADPVNGYARFIDAPSWIDHHILNVLAKNVDALRLSAYFFKRRGGSIEFGPIWDFDRSMQSTDGRDDAPDTWNGTGDGTSFFTYPWWGRLFQDAAFDRAYRSRWLELRDGAFSTENIFAVIEGYRSALEEPAARNFERWSSSLVRGGWDSEVEILKGWLKARVEWIDGQFISAPELSRAPGFFEAPFELRMQAERGEIYYTINGPDPVLGPAAPEVRIYDGTPVLITGTSRVRARARISALGWSTLVEAVFHDDALPLAVTEIMFNPKVEGESAFTATNYEWIELQNVGDRPIDLRGVRLEPLARFRFSGSAVESLGPGEFVVVVRRRDAFARLYGEDGIRIAGEFAGLLSNTSQDIAIFGELGQEYLRFRYANWYPETDGGGRSLVLREPRAGSTPLSDRESWRPSFEAGGSPGREDLSPGGRRLPGDLDGSGRLDLADPVGLLQHLFLGGKELPCAGPEGKLALLDANGDLSADLSDALALLGYLFLGGAEHILGADCVPIAGCSDACPGQP
jgi:hypothetical protein